MSTEEGEGGSSADRTGADVLGQPNGSTGLSRRAAVVRLGAGVARAPYIAPAIAVIGVARAEGFGKSGRHASGRGKAKGKQKRKPKLD